jgi:hypothetical protein
MQDVLGFGYPAVYADGGSNGTAAEAAGAVVASILAVGGMMACPQQ